jgi:hypothetical protein
MELPCTLIAPLMNCSYRTTERSTSHNLTLLLLVALGGEVEEQPWGRLFSHDIWHFDTECIEDDGDYSALAERLALLAKGCLPIERVRDRVDIESGEIWIEFELDGTTKRYEPVIDNNWVDPAIFEWFVSLVSARSTKGNFTYMDLGGQDCLIGFSEPDVMKRLRRATGLDFKWLS